jgi:hypothetical protein
VTEPAAIARELLAAIAAHEPADAGLMRIEPRQQAGTRRAAAAGVVTLREPQAAGREAIEVRRANLAAVAAEIRPTQVVGEDDENVWPVGGRWIACHGDRDSRHDDCGDA